MAPFAISPQISSFRNDAGGPCSRTNPTRQHQSNENPLCFKGVKWGLSLGGGWVQNLSEGDGFANLRLRSFFYNKSTMPFYDLGIRPARAFALGPDLQMDISGSRIGGSLGLALRYAEADLLYEFPFPFWGIELSLRGGLGSYLADKGAPAFMDQPYSFIAADLLAFSTLVDRMLPSLYFGFGIRREFCSAKTILSQTTRLYPVLNAGIGLF